MKKIITIFLMISFLNLISCYYYQVEKEQFISKKEKLDIKVVTRDSNVYYFEAGKYFVENDTIKGLFKKEIEYNKYNYENVQIPLNEIKEYRIENTGLYISIVFAVMFTVVVFLVMKGSDDPMGIK